MLLVLEKKPLPRTHREVARQLTVEESGCRHQNETGMGLGGHELWS